MTEEEIVEHWKKTYNYLDLQLTSFEEAVRQYICQVNGVHPFKPIPRVSDSKYYKSYQYYGIRYTELFKYNFKEYLQLDKCETL